MEDNKLFARILEFNLTNKLNLEIHNFSSGEECLSNLDLNPDLIILDFTLPGINGLETLKKIKKHNPKINVIALSHQTNKKVIDEFIKEGALCYIDKNDNPLVELMTYIKKIQKSKKK